MLRSVLLFFGFYSCVDGNLFGEICNQAMLRVSCF